MADRWTDARLAAKRASGHLAECRMPTIALAENLDALLDTLEAHERPERAFMRDFVRLDDAGTGSEQMTTV